MTIDRSGKELLQSKAGTAFSVPQRVEGCAKPDNADRPNAQRSLNKPIIQDRCQLHKVAWQAAGGPALNYQSSVFCKLSSVMQTTARH